jgi:hypothetical protein
MQQRCDDTQTEILPEHRLADEAHHLREQASLLPPGAVCEAAICRAGSAEAGSPLRGRLRSPDVKVLS